MKHPIGMDYYSYGNRQGVIPESHPLENKAIKDKAYSLIERNFLLFDKKSERYGDIPEYKQYRQTSDMNYSVNDYMNPLHQYRYIENPLNQSALDSQLYSLQKSKRYISTDKEIEKRPDIQCNNTQSSASRNHNPANTGRMILKERINENILQPNILHVKSNSRFARRFVPPSVNPCLDRIKSNSYLESKEAPEYLRLYDKERLGEIDNYYINKGENLSVLSRFGNWITVTPKHKNRKHSLEKAKQGTYETSIVAPQWMEIKHNVIAPNIFRAAPVKNTNKNKANVTILIDRNQRDVLPNHLRSAYDRYSTSSL